MADSVSSLPPKPFDGNDLVDLAVALGDLTVALADLAVAINDLAVTLAKISDHPLEDTVYLVAGAVAGTIVFSSLSRISISPTLTTISTTLRSISTTISTTLRTISTTISTTLRSISTNISTTISSILKKKSNAKAVAVGDDLISQLPDEILVSIVTRLSAKDARRSSSLSKRWGDLYRCVTDVNICCRDLLSICDDIFNPIHGGLIADLMLKRLDWMILHYYGRRIRSLQLKCCISNVNRFEKCMCYLRNSNVEALDLCFSCSEKPSELCFPLDHLHVLHSLKLLRLSLCVLQPKLGCQSFSLQTLELKSVKVFPGSLEYILSSCLKLQSLSICECDCPSEISISGPNLQLKYLIIRYCKGVEKIVICASNLVVLDCENWERVNFIFDHVPQLQTLHFNVQGENFMSRLRDFAEVVPKLKSMSFVTTGDFYQLSSRLMTLGVETFSELRQLVLFVCCTTKINLLSLTPFLQGCPVLQEFRLDLQHLNYEEGPLLREWSFHLSELKKVEISGFSGKDNEIDFALFILRSAVKLEQMRIIWFPKCYKRCCGWITMSREEWNEETIQQQLQGQAISENAQLILNHIHTHTSGIVRRNINLKIDKVPRSLPIRDGLRAILI